MSDEAEDLFGPSSPVTSAAAPAAAPRREKRKRKSKKAKKTKRARKARPPPSSSEDEYASSSSEDGYASSSSEDEIGEIEILGSEDTGEGESSSSSEEEEEEVNAEFPRIIVGRAVAYGKRGQPTMDFLEFQPSGRPKPGGKCVKVVGHAAKVFSSPLRMYTLWVSAPDAAGLHRVLDIEAVAPPLVGISASMVKRAFLQKFNHFCPEETRRAVGASAAKAVQKFARDGRLSTPLDKDDLRAALATLRPYSLVHDICRNAMEDEAFMRRACIAGQEAAEKLRDWDGWKMIIRKGGDDEEEEEEASDGATRLVAFETVMFAAPVEERGVAKMVVGMRLRETLEMSAAVDTIKEAAALFHTCARQPGALRTTANALDWPGPVRDLLRKYGMQVKERLMYSGETAKDLDPIVDHLEGGFPHGVRILQAETDCGGVFVERLRNALRTATALVAPDAAAEVAAGAGAPVENGGGAQIAVNTTLVVVSDDRASYLKRTIIVNKTHILSDTMLQPKSDVFFGDTDVAVVDRAHTISTRDMRILLGHMRSAGVKHVVFVGSYWGMPVGVRSAMREINAFVHIKQKAVITRGYTADAEVYRARWDRASVLVFPPGQETNDALVPEELRQNTRVTYYAFAQRGQKYYSHFVVMMNAPGWTRAWFARVWLRACELGFQKIMVHGGDGEWTRWR